MRHTGVAACWLVVVLLAAGAVVPAGALPENTPHTGASSLGWNDILTPNILFATLILLGFSAFFSASEVAFYSLHQIRLRSMRQSPHMLDRLAARLMDHPGSLLTSILMGNCIVNVLLGVVLAVRVEELFRDVLLPPQVASPVVSYVIAVTICTAVLVFFGEITPKLIVVHRSESFARFAAVPIYLIDRALTPVRHGLLLFIGFVFRVTRFSKVRPAPFMTDAEFKSILSEGEATGVIEEDERQMIQGILEFGDVMLREILVPRPDMIALKETASVGEALALFREHEFSRIPVYKDDMDSIAGLLYAKDLLPQVDQGILDEPIRPLLRPVHFVPETMSVADFLKTVQRLRTHLAIVVDEFGGTEGLVTMQDALREVVGDVGEEEEAPSSQEIKPGVYRIEGGFPLDELEELAGVPVEDEEHTTVAGFLMEQTEKILEVGDELEHKGVRYTVEEMDGKRVSRLVVHVPLEEDGEKREEEG